MYVNRQYYADENYDFLEEDFNTKELATSVFELIEDETIDIESIEELDNTCYDINNMTDDEIECYHNYTRSKINIILQWAKQQERRMKKLENNKYCQVCGVELTEENRYMNGMCNDCKYGEK